MSARIDGRCHDGIIPDTACASASDLNAAAVMRKNAFMVTDMAYKKI